MSDRRYVTATVSIRLRPLFTFVLNIIHYFGWLGWLRVFCGRYVISVVLVRRRSSGIQFRWILWIETINRTVRIGIRLIGLRIYDYASGWYAGYTGDRPHHRLVIRFRGGEILTRYLRMTARHVCHGRWRWRRRYRGVAALALRFVAAARRAQS